MSRASDSIAITPGTGAEVATVKVGSLRHQVMVLSDEFGHVVGTVPTYRLLIPAQAVGADKVFFDLFHVGGTDRTVRVLSVRAIKDDGTATQLYLTRTTDVGAGGTAATYNGTSLSAPGLSPMDPANDDASVYVSARSAPASGATAGALIAHRSVLSEADFLALSVNDIQPLVVPAGTGIRMVQGSTAGTGNLTFEVMLEVVGPPLVVPTLVEGTEPTITGQGILDEQLSVSSGTWEGYPTPTISYQWETWDGSAWVSVASGGTVATYTPSVAGDYRCVITASSTAGTTTYETPAVTVVSQYFAPENSVPPDITGDTTLGSTLTCGVGTWTANPSPAFSYQWERWITNAFVAIGGATSSTYVTAHDGDHRCVVTATNSEGGDSEPSNVLNIGTAAPAPSMVESPQASGNAYTNSTITAHPGVWSGDSITHSYQWQEQDATTGEWTDVVGETAATFTPVDAGRYGCLVGASNAGGSATPVRTNAVNISPAPTAEVIHLNEPFNSAGDWVVPTGCSITGGSFHFNNNTANVTADKPLSLPAGTYTIMADLLAGNGTTKGNITFRMNNGAYIQTAPAYTDVLGPVSTTIVAAAAVTDFEIRVTRQDSAMDIKVDNVVVKTPGTSEAPRLDYSPVAMGTGTVNEPLSVTNGVWFASPEPAYTYLWQVWDSVSWTSAPGTNNLSTYTPTSNGDYRCLVTATNSVTSTSAPSNPLTVTGGSVGTGTYTRGRILIDDLWGGAEPMIATCNFHAVLGGLKLAGTPSASSEAGALTSAAMAHDTNVDSYWQSSLDRDTVPWWELAFNEPAEIKQVTLAFPDVEDFYKAESLRNFRIQGWDGSSWTTLKTVTNDPVWTPGTSRTYNI